jgi:hypothetical protein
MESFPRLFLAELDPGSLDIPCLLAILQLKSDSEEFMRRLFPTMLAIAALGCCGLMSREGEDPTRTSGSRQETASSARKAEFAGSYRIVDPNYEGLTLEITRRGGYYHLEWSVPESEPWSAYGIVVGNSLGACEGGEDATLAIYKRDGNNLSALWCDGERVSAFDTTSGAQPLKVSSRSFAGTYGGKSNDLETGEHYNYTLRLVRSGDMYEAQESFDDGSSVDGFGFAYDDVIIMGFPVGGSMVVKMFEMKGSRLDGKFFYSYYDEGTGEDRVSIGSETATRK